MEPEYKNYKDVNNNKIIMQLLFINNNACKYKKIQPEYLLRTFQRVETVIKKFRERQRRHLT